MSYLDRITATLVRRWLELARRESGQTLVEYGLIITVVSLGAIAALYFLGDNIKALFSSAGSSLPS